MDTLQNTVIARSEKSQESIQITDPKFLMGPYGTFINFETHSSRIYTVPWVKVIFIGFLEAHFIRESKNLAKLKRYLASLS
jgi:hypothetical protein